MSEFAVESFMDLVQTKCSSDEQGDRVCVDSPLCHS